jgi:hypothetical protein
LSDVAWISNARGESRLLFRLDDLGDLRNAVIGRAVLHLPLVGEVARRTMQVQVHPVLSSWDAASVTWNGGWERPGGDLHDELYVRRRVDLSRGEESLAIDLTLLLKEIVEDGMEAEGFVLTVPPFEGDGLSVEDADQFMGVGQATLELAYRKVPNPPPHAPRAGDKWR